MYEVGNLRMIVLVKKFFFFLNFGVFRFFSSVAGLGRVPFITAVQLDRAVRKLYLT